MLALCPTMPGLLAGRGGLRRWSGVPLSDGTACNCMCTGALPMALRSAHKSEVRLPAQAVGGTYASLGVQQLPPEALGQDEPRRALLGGPQAREGPQHCPHVLC